MTTKQTRVAVRGSERTAVAGARIAGDVHPDERIEVTIRLRPKTRSVQNQLLKALGG